MPSVELDSQGERFLPHACLACHGGRFDSQSGRVSGASPLALDPRGLAQGATLLSEYPPSNLKLSGLPQWLRNLHTAMSTSSVAPGVQAYINDISSGGYLDFSGIPTGWQGQPDIYRKIYRPYCASCHSAQSGPLDFRAWADLVREKERVKRAICTGRMPHSEVPFRKFWSEGGDVLLPGWLLGALGYSGCGP